MKDLRAIFLCAVSALCACRGAQVPAKGGEDPIDCTLGTEKGHHVNGPSLNGTELGTALDRRTLDHALLASLTSAKGESLADAALTGATIVSPAHPGIDLVGATMKGVTVDGVGVELRIDALAPKEGAPEVRLHLLSYRAGPSAEWSPLCPKNARALPIAGRWSYAVGKEGAGAPVAGSTREITWACAGAAIAECALAGYPPWKDELRALHQSCVRALRADYCGNGAALTEAGMSVNLYDAHAIQKDAYDWRDEASWSPAGASCVKRVRIETLDVGEGAPSRSRLEVRRYLQACCPRALARDADEPCSEKSAEVRTEIPPGK